MECNYRYYVYADLIDLDDFGKKQVSTYSTCTDSATRLTPTEALELAIEEYDWRIDYGQGEWDRVDTCIIEEETPDGVLTQIADKFKCRYAFGL